MNNNANSIERPPKEFKLKYLALQMDQAAPQHIQQGQPIQTMVPISEAAQTINCW
jgi:hypothetical protein